MKKRNLFLILVLLCCYSTQLIAQLRWYAEGGLDYSLIPDYELSTNGKLYSSNPDIYVKKASKEKFKNEFGQQLALGATLYRNQFNFDTALELNSLNFSMQGQYYTFYYDATPTPQTSGRLGVAAVDDTYYYLSLPLMANVSVADQLFSFGVGAVPQLLLYTKDMFKDENPARKFGCALQAQVKWKMSSRITLIGAYRQNITTLFDSDFLQPSESKSRTARLSLRYYLGKKI